MATVEALFDGTAEKVRVARSWLRETMRNWGVCAEIQDDAVLVLSELASNAVTHSLSGAPGGTYRAVLDVDDTRMRITVIDLGGIGYPRLHQPSPSTPKVDMEVHGRGLDLIHQLAHGWWVSTSNHQCAVTAELALNGAQP